MCSRVKKQSPIFWSKGNESIIENYNANGPGFLIGAGASSASDDVYADFPITLKGYDGTSKTSVSYGGQMARHMLHNGLKKAASSGDVNKMNMYFNGAESVPILDPKSSEKFPIKQTKVEELSKEDARKNLQRQGHWLAGQHDWS